MRTDVIVGVDIGGTSIGAGCIVNKEIVKTHSLPTGAERTAEEILETLYEVIEKVMLPETKAIGVGVPGLINAGKGEIVKISNIPAWNGLGLVEKLSSRFNIPVYIENDANCFALGEKHFGKGQKFDNMVAVALGTGVGGGIIINNKLHSGLFGGAGEVGHMPYKDSIFEAYCGSGFFNKINNITGKELFDKAMEGDENALALFNEFGHHIGKLVTTIMYILAPDAIIFGGSISKSFPLFKEGIQEEVAEFPFDVMKDIITIEQSELDDIAILGAAGLYYNA
ncbi:ROK family protein [Maribacter sp. TH_r10]|uniref:ROK family protein n=1 Tax=Maribacter luteus TaxID=2594478 RepID=A0A6I2MJW0_9FLAO|nr:MULTISPECIES: ROK family protein [Maribacter]MDV7137712.1 ROK family protein [Maribacter sp. TH_r10]MRX63117.1 ROK family protein [Maribacter luteus]